MEPPVNIDRNYFIQLIPNLHQKWKGAIETFRDNAAKVSEVIEKVKNKELGLSYNRETHKFDEIPVAWSTHTTVTHLCSEWLHDQLTILVQSIGMSQLASKPFVKFLEEKASHSSNKDVLIPYRLGQFLIKVSENKVKNSARKGTKQDRQSHKSPTKNCG